MKEIPSTVVKRRLAVEKWKERNREYYLDQKRRLAHRPEYLARRRQMYKIKRAKNIEHLDDETSQTSETSKLAK